MNNLLVYSHKISAVMLLLCAPYIFAQEKYSESFKASDDMVVTVNTSHTNVIFETWNKDKVEVEAYVEDENLSEEEKKKIFDSWNFSVMGNSNQVIISSNSGNAWRGMDDMAHQSVMPQMDFLGPLMNEMLLPMISEMNIPALEHIGQIQFDYEAFEKDEEAYLKKFEAQMDEKFGKDFEKDMEAWGENFAKQWEQKFENELGPEMEKRMEAWGETFGKNMEAWGETIGKDMEKWAEQFEQQMEEGNGTFTKKVITTPNGSKTYLFKGNNAKPSKNTKANKYIIIKMPKNSKTEINVRHGEIKMADVTNVKATLNYSPFTANSIDGRETSINASYSPVIINNWKYGTLVVQFVQNCTLANVESINLQANSSDVAIGNIEKEAILSGSFGALQIDKVSTNFDTLNIFLENTDATVKLPATAFSFQFNGKKSTLQYPKSLQATQSKNYDRVLVRGFNTNKNSGNSLTINATYSNIKLQ